MRTQFAYLIGGLALATGADKGASQSPLEVEIARGKCRSSPASSIPVMEKALKNARIALPPRG